LAQKEERTGAISLEALLKRSDFITIHVSLLPEAYYMIGEKEFDAMKYGCFASF